jgi:hypothetical protein
VASMINTFYFTRMFFLLNLRSTFLLTGNYIWFFFCKVKHSGDLTCETHSTPCQQIRCYTVASDHRRNPRAYSMTVNCIFQSTVTKVRKRFKFND